MQDEGRATAYVFTLNNPSHHLLGHSDGKDAAPSYSKTDFDKYYHSLPEPFRSQVRYLCVGLEKGEEGGTYHLQGFIHLFKQQRRSFLFKVIPAGTFRAVRGGINRAIDYVLQEDFQHEDGRPKGGDRYWQYEIGNRLESNSRRGDVSPTETRLLDLKRKYDHSLDNGWSQDRAIALLWHTDFYMMLRYHVGFRAYAEVADFCEH